MVYSRCMTDLEKEHVLHKVVAASAFLFALMILPVAQYLLVNSKADNGQVAGVSTDQTITRSNVTNPVECSQKKDQDLADLTKFEDGKKRALLRDYQTAVQPYQAAQQVLTGTPEQIQTEKAALDKLIDAEYQPYLKKLSDVQTAVDTQRQQINAEVCATP